MKERKKGKKERENLVFINFISLEITVITYVYSYLAKFVGWLQLGHKICRTPIGG